MADQLAGALLTTIATVKVHWDGKAVSYISGLAVDADGSPRAYHPNSSKGLDHWANAGTPGNWWALVTDEIGKPILQGPTDPAPGYYVSTTSLARKKYKVTDPRRYIDAERIPYVVIPLKLRPMVSPKFLGCHCLVENLENGKKVIAVCADLGPNNKIGEGSIALAVALSVPSNPRKGGTSKKIIRYTLYPGVPAKVNGETFVL